MKFARLSIVCWAGVIGLAGLSGVRLSHSQQAASPQAPSQSASSQQGSPQQTLAPPSYTEAQAKRGQETYVARCATCHGDNLDDGQFAVALKGPPFRQHWGGQGVDAPFAFMSANMPPTDPGGLPAATYADLMAFILSKNDVPPGSRELPADVDALKGMAAPH